LTIIGSGPVAAARKGNGKEGGRTHPTVPEGWEKHVPISVASSKKRSVKREKKNHPPRTKTPSPQAFLDRTKEMYGRST